MVGERVDVYVLAVGSLPKALFNDPAALGVYNRDADQQQK
jgi:hypothetical protein